jgi:hypothetical protein
MGSNARRRLFAVLLVTAGGLAWGKGYSGRVLTDTPTSHISGSYVELLAGSCFVPTTSDCLSGTWTSTRCGQEELTRMLNDEPGATCRDACLLVPPNIQTCTSPQWLNSVCGRVEMESFHWAGSIADGGVHPSTCAEALKGLAPQLLGSQPVEEVMSVDHVRLTVDGGVETVSPDAGRATLRVEPYTRNDHQFTGMATTFFGYRMQQFTELSKVNINQDFVSAIQNEHALWEANGNQVNSCREYAYEKYYDDSLYEDATASAGSDYRLAYKVAYAPGTIATPARSALGYWGKRGVPISQRDGTPLPTQIGFPTGPQPKNVFFSTKVFTSRPGVTGPLTREALLAKFAANPASFPGGRPTTAQLVIMDDALNATLLDGQANHTHTEDWAWHESMSNQLAAVALDEELYAMDRVKDAYEGLLYRRQLILDAIAAYWQRVILQGLSESTIYQDNPLLGAGGGLGDPAGDPVDVFLGGQKAERNTWWTATTGFAHQFTDFSAAGSVSGALDSSPFGGASGVGAITTGLKSGAVGVGRLRTQTFMAGSGRLAGPLDDAPTGLDYGTAGLAIARLLPSSGDPLKTLTLMLAQTDDELEAALLHARDLGCLDVTGPNKCDWSPRLFYQRVQDPYSRYREPEYQRCLEKTAQDGFGIIRTPPSFAVSGTVVSVKHHGVDRVCNLPDYGINPDSVDLFVACHDRFAAKSVLALQSALAGEGTVYGPKFFGKQMGDSAQVGNDNFNVSMSYAMGWRIDNLDAVVHDNHCALQPSVDGSFDVTAKALFLEQKLLHADARAELKAEGKAHARLEILGESIWTKDSTLVPHAFNVIDASGGLDATLLSASATFVIVVVPITIRGGVAGSVGAGASIGGGTPEGSASGCARGNIYLTGAFKPFAHVNGFASASVDLIIVEAGVKMTLTLVDAELPLEAELLFKLENPTDPDLTLYAKTNLDLVLSLMSGSLKAYAEICYIIDCDKYETTIFSWDGPSFKKNLFHSEFQISLGPIITWATSL